MKPIAPKAIGRRSIPFLLALGSSLLGCNNARQAVQCAGEAGPEVSAPVGQASLVSEQSVAKLYRFLRQAQPRLSGEYLDLRLTNRRVDSLLGAKAASALLAVAMDTVLPWDLVGLLVRSDAALLLSHRSQGIALLDSGLLLVSASMDTEPFVSTADRSSRAFRGMLLLGHFSDALSVSPGTQRLALRGTMAALCRLRTEAGVSANRQARAGSFRRLVIAQLLVGLERHSSSWTKGNSSRLLAAWPDSSEGRSIGEELKDAREAANLVVQSRPR